MYEQIRTKKDELRETIWDTISSCQQSKELKVMDAFLAFLRGPNVEVCGDKICVPYAMVAKTEEEKSILLGLVKDSTRFIVSDPPRQSNCDYFYIKAVSRYQDD